jgi:sulfhydrogenase subunit gamma (sulfur reductase)
MADPVAQELFAHARVIEAWDETATLRALRVDLGELVASHLAPGQVVKLRTPAGEGYFALASAPSAGDGQVELLLKRGAPVADAVIATATPGSTVEASAPFGKGFPVAQAHGRDLFLFAVGSGITPIRALVQKVLRERASYGRAALFYGQRADEDFAFRKEHAAWEAAGVQVVLCASRASDTWQGRRGYVQDVAHSLAWLELDLSRAVAFLCGTKAMVTGVRELLGKAGVTADRTYLNF